MKTRKCSFIKFGGLGFRFWLKTKTLTENSGTVTTLFCIVHHFREAWHQQNILEKSKTSLIFNIPKPVRSQCNAVYHALVVYSTHALSVHHLPPQESVSPWLHILMKPEASHLWILIRDRASIPNCLGMSWGNLLYMETLPGRYPFQFNVIKILNFIMEF